MTLLADIRMFDHVSDMMHLVMQKLQQSPVSSRQCTHRPQDDIERDVQLLFGYNLLGGNRNTSCRTCKAARVLVQIEYPSQMQLMHEVDIVDKHHTDES